MIPQHQIMKDPPRFDNSTSIKANSRSTKLGRNKIHQKIVYNMTREIGTRFISRRV
ncbi:hypothetical protein GBA52_013702 [Prunus armeniaca]|nr:hypothetical protein GBA52_013702 [Prunus armeniaca]